MTNYKSSQHEQVLKEWLSQYKSLPESSLKKYSETVCEKNDVVTAFKLMASHISSDAMLNLVQSSCHQLFDFYRSGNQNLKIYSLAFLPAMINGYLLSCYSRDQLAAESKASFETYLLAIYNLICVENSEAEYLHSMEIPNLARPSIYHDPMTYPFSEHTITMSNTDSTYVELPVPVTYETVGPSNRYKILNTILRSYCDHISVVSKTSLVQLCNICEKLATHGFPWSEEYSTADILKKNRRIQLDTNFTTTLVKCVYYALYNHCKAKGIKALEAVLKRAEYELNTQVLLLCNAILNTVYQEGGTASTDDPLGVSAALTPILVRSNSGISRLAVTASSIRHHRWRHRSEEVSGDVTESLHQENLSLNPKASNRTLQTHDAEEGTSFSRNDKQSAISPSKLIKTKLKKNVPIPSAVDRGQKANNPNEKKGKKWLSAMSSQEDESHEQPRIRTPSGNSGEGSSSQNPFSSASLPSLKQISIDGPNVDESTKLPTSKSIDSNTKNGSAESPTTQKKGKAEKSKHKGKLNSDTEILDLLSGLRRSGSKKHKETKTTTQPSVSVPLLNSSEIENEDNVTTEL